MAAPAVPAVVAGSAAAAGPYIGYRVGQRAEEKWGIGKAIGDWLVPGPVNPAVVPVPRVDPTGKVHGDIPKQIPRDWSGTDIRDAIDELSESIETRLEEEDRLGHDQPHRDRINDEIDFLNKLRDRLRELRKHR